MYRTASTLRSALTLIVFAGFASPTLPAAELPESVLPEFQESVAAQFEIAGDNAGELSKALTSVEGDEVKGMCFLIANMPERDLKTLSAEYLLNNVRYAYRARKETPWGTQIPESLFLNHVLPYASINERRDDWRKDFYERFIKVAKDCSSPTEAVGKLNVAVFSDLNVKYHATKRPKPDQSPYESIDAGFASCSGLSVLLIDACRAVGIPARFVGTPLWSNRRGNHSWVEVWDQQWHFVGACEPGPLDRTWFLSQASKADETQMQHRIYATSFRKTETWFPLVWDRRIRYVSATDVTRSYTTRCKVTFYNTGDPASVVIRRGDELVAAGAVDDELTLTLAGNFKYVVEVSRDNAKAARAEVQLTDEKDQEVDLP